jgi:VIT1/CCC1 family predicted Fe2+/Mn2+ transporter
MYLRNFVFGVEDSLVSTVGLLSGVAIAGVPKGTIILTGVVLIFVEAFSMAVGSYLSEYSVEEYTNNVDHSGLRPIGASIIMFLSYFVAGFVPLLPYLLYEGKTAFYVSIVFSCTALFVLGLISGLLSKNSPLKDGIRMFILGGVAILIGALVGSFFVG